MTRRHPAHLFALLVLFTSACGDDAPAAVDQHIVTPLPDGSPSDASLRDAGADRATDGSGDTNGAADASPADAWLPADGPQPDAPAPLRDDALAPWDWYTQASKIANRQALTTAFAQAGYSPPTNLYLIAARVVAGQGQPALELFSYKDTGFTYSPGHFWPASTVKLTAAVGALWTLGSYGLTGAAQVSFQDDDGSYSGTVANLYDKALSVSDNVAYNRLVELAGFDAFNDQFLVAARGLPQMVLQRRYTKPLPTSNLRTSPTIAYVEGAKSGTIPQRVGTGSHPECPSEGNCTTLFELLDGLRRVTLHDELPVAERFPLVASDASGLKAALLAAVTDMQPGAGQALGHPVTIYNKTGLVPGNDHLDHGLIVDNTSGERFLIALSLPYAASTSSATISTVAKQTLLALKAAPAAATLQRDAGTKIMVQLDDKGPASGGARAYDIKISAPGADRLSIWVDGWPIGSPTTPSPHFELSYQFSQAGERLMVVHALAAGQLIGYRALRIKVN